MLVLILLAALPQLIYAAPTPEQVASLRAFGMDPNFSGYEPVLKILWGGCDYDPYQRLERVKNGNAQITPKVTGNGGAGEVKGGIHPTLACRLTKLIEAFPQCNIRINSAFRAVQGCKPGPGCAPQGLSCHQYGLAVDISSTCQGQLAQFLGVRTSTSQGAQQFKLHFGYQLPGTQPNHIQCVENGVASCNPNTKPCDGNGAITGGSSYVPPSPTSAFTDSIRNVLGMQPAQPAAPALPALPSQPLGQTQSPLSSFNSNPTPLVSDSLVTTGTGATTSNSIADRLNELVNGTTATTTQSATSVPLVINSNDVRNIESNAPQNSHQTGTAQIGGGITQTTFTNNPQPLQTTPNTNLTRYQSILSSFRAALQLMLNYLRPFGRATNDEHGSEEHLE